MADSKGSAN